MSVYTYPRHREQHALGYRQPDDCPWCTQETNRRLAEIEANEAARDIADYEAAAVTTHAQTHHTASPARFAAWLLVAAIALALFLTTDQQWTGWHWAAAITDAALAIRLAWTGDTR